MILSLFFSSLLFVIGGIQLHVMSSSQLTEDKPYSIVVGSVASDGVPPALTPTPVTPTPTPVPPTQRPVTPIPLYQPDVERWRGLVALIFPPWYVDVALRVMDCESKGLPGATGAASERGLFQIHPIHHDSTYDPEGNVRAAYRISKGGNDWSAWSCY